MGIRCTSSTLALTAVILWSSVTCAWDLRAPALGLGDIRFVAAGGIGVLDRQTEAITELSFELGLSDRLVYGAPLALEIRLLDYAETGTLSISGGIVDWYVSRDGALFYSPSVALSTSLRMGSESAFRLSLDFTGAEEGIQRGDHGAWFRGGMAVLAEVGEYVTITLGVAYQRRVTGSSPSEELHELGWAGDSRVSIGSVQSQPFGELPLVAIHMQPFMDFIAITRFDINIDDNTTDTRLLFGIQQKR